jgi:hypothetical protein
MPKSAPRGVVGQDRCYLCEPEDEDEIEEELERRDYLSAFDEVFAHSRTLTRRISEGCERAFVAE